MRHSIVTILLILCSVLLHSGAVLSDTAPRPYENDLTTEAQLLQAVRILERKAAEETKVLQSLNERIDRLALKIAALQPVFKHNAPNQSATELEAWNKPRPVSIESSPNIRVAGNTAENLHITSDSDTISDEAFHLTDLQNDITSPYLLPASGGLLAILILLATIHHYRKKHQRLPASRDDLASATKSNENKNPIAVNEKNALVAKKLAALRAATEKGKQVASKQSIENTLKNPKSG